MGKRKQGKNQGQQAISAAGLTIASENDHRRHKKKGRAIILPTPAITGCFEPYPLKELIAARKLLINSIKGSCGPVWDPLKEKLGMFSDGHKRLCTNLPQSWLPQPVPFQKWCRPVVIKSVSGYNGITISLPVCDKDGSSKPTQPAVSESSKTSKKRKSSDAAKICSDDVLTEKPVTKTGHVKRKYGLNDCDNGSAAVDTHNPDGHSCISKKKKKESHDAVPLHSDLSSSTMLKTVKVTNSGCPAGTEVAKEKKFHKKTLVVSVKNDLISGKRKNDSRKAGVDDKKTANVFRSVSFGNVTA